MSVNLIVQYTIVLMIVLLATFALFKHFKRHPSTCNSGCAKCGAGCESGQKTEKNHDIDIIKAHLIDK